MIIYNWFDIVDGLEHIHHMFCFFTQVYNP